jgi:hypothetical protein
MKRDRTVASGSTIAGGRYLDIPLACSKNRERYTMSQHTCTRCLRLISPYETFQVHDGQVAHQDCNKRYDLSHEERALLFRYCFDHVVATCRTCAQEFRQGELGSDLLGNRSHLCPRCRIDLMEQVREHVYNCTALPSEVRRRAREVRAAARMLVKESHQATDRADVLMRETEAAIVALHESMRSATGN